MLQILKNATRLFPQIANLPSDDTQDSWSQELFCYFTPFWKDYVYPCFYLAQPLMYMTSKMKFITKSDNKSRTRYPGPSPGIPSTFPPSASPFPFPQTSQKTLPPHFFVTVFNFEQAIPTLESLSSTFKVDTSTKHICTK